MNIALLRLLQSHPDDYFWPEPLADSLQISPARLLRDLRELEAFGFGFESQPHRGWRYARPAVRLCVDQIEWELATRVIGRRISVWQRVTSTNDLAARAARSRSNHGLVVMAEEQTAGRGRRDRHWFAPPQSSILMSVLLFAPERIRNTALLTSLAAVAVAEIVIEMTGLPARIKWPNDVRLEGRKICGILVEDFAPRRTKSTGASPSEVSGGTGQTHQRRTAGACRATVIGVGINVNIDPRDFPRKLETPATSLSAHLGRPLDRSELARCLIQKLDQYYNRLLDGKTGELWTRWRQIADLVGRGVRIERQQDSIVGQLLDLHPNRDLVLKDAVGELHNVPVADILSLQELS